MMSALTHLESTHLPRKNIDVVGRGVAQTNRLTCWIPSGFRYDSDAIAEGKGRLFATNTLQAIVIKTAASRVRDLSHTQGFSVDTACFTLTYFEMLAPRKWSLIQSSPTTSLPYGESSRCALRSSLFLIRVALFGQFHGGGRNAVVSVRLPAASKTSSRDV